MSKKSFKKNIGLSTYLVVVMFVILPMAGFYFGKELLGVTIDNPLVIRL